MSNPRIMWHSEFNLETASVSSTYEDEGTAPENIFKPDTVSRWRASDDTFGEDITATLDGVAVSCNYIAIGGIPNPEDAGFITIHISEIGDFTDEILLDTVYNDPGIPDAEPISKVYYGDYMIRAIRCSWGGQCLIKGISNLMIGNYLEMQRPYYSGAQGLLVTSNDEIRPAMTASGNILNRRVVRKGIKHKASFRHLTTDWYMSEFQPFVDHAVLYPFFYAWNPDEEPGAIIYGGVASNINPSKMGVLGYYQVDFEIMGLK